MRERTLFGFWTLFLNPRRITRAAIIVKPSTLLKFHTALTRRKYRLLYSAGKPGKPGPKGPPKEIIDAIVAMKRRNPRFGCPRIAQQVNLAFGLSIDKDVVRRILAKHYRPDPDCTGPSWLTFIGHAKDSLWSVDLFRCESILLKSHWILVVMDQFTRRIIGFGVHAGDVDGVSLCRMFNTAISTRGIPRYLSSDNDPLFQYHRWHANLRILDVKEIKSVPYVPLSHPFVERLIGTIRREYLDNTLFWNASDLKKKLEEFQQYYNSHRVHTALEGDTPSESGGEAIIHHIDPNQYRWKSHSRGLYQLPIAA
jgi:transposase InsO family protein